MALLQVLYGARGMERTSGAWRPLEFTVGDFSRSPRM
jgi:hypothetical protein